MKKKAFTLTELLVVVVIIGVLSAVVLPKFTKVIESRKTTEAEEMMAAVRNEQEARCTISKNYQADLSKLASYRAGKNFTYEDNEGVGMMAKATSGKYTLKMPSYADGRICCDDDYCQENLNKSYPKCSELTDLVPANADCSAAWEDEGEKVSNPEPGVTECTDGEEQEKECTNNCGDKGIQKNRCVAGQWTGWGACSAADKESCGPVTGDCVDGTTSKLGETPGGCAEILLSCVNGKWVYPPQTVLKEGNECWKDEDNKACVDCHWTDDCPAGKEKIDGICCYKGQKVVNGKCLYKYRPNRFDVGILVVCHGPSWELSTGAQSIISEEQFNSGYMGYNQQYSSYEAYKNAQVAELTKGRHTGGSNPPACYSMGTAYYRGGSIPWVTDPGPGDCDPHYAYYYGGDWWAGGTRITGTKVYGTDQEWCDTYCGPYASCSKNGIIDYGNPPGKCGAYHCSNGWHCDNAPGGTGVALECIRE